MPRPIRRRLERHHRFLIGEGYKGFSTAQSSISSACAAPNTAKLVFQDAKCRRECAERRRARRHVLMSPPRYDAARFWPPAVGHHAGVLDVVFLCADRKQFGQSIGEFQLMQGKIAGHVQYLSAPAALTSIGGLKPATEAKVRVKTRRRDPLCCRKGHLDGSGGIQAWAANGYINEFPTGRLLRDAKLYEIGAGTSEIRGC